jgi:YggT family protein
MGDRRTNLLHKEAAAMTSYIAQFVYLLFEVLSFAILGRVLLSWVDPMGNMRISQVLRDVTEPILAPIRSLMPNMPMFDISPIIAMLLLQALGRLVVMAIQGG